MSEPAPSLEARDAPSSTPSSPRLAASPPVLVAEGARIAVDEVERLRALELSTEGARVLLVGDTEPLARVLLGISNLAYSNDISAIRAAACRGAARVVEGRLALAGRDVGKGEHFDVLAPAPRDTPGPKDLSVLEWITASAMMGGAPRRAATRLALSVLERYGLAARRLETPSHLSLLDRRVLALAAADARDPRGERVLVAEGPLDGLDGVGAQRVLAALAEATRTRRALVTVARLSRGTPAWSLAEHAHTVAVLGHGRVLAAGSPAELFDATTMFRLHVPEGALALRDALVRADVVVDGPLDRPVVRREGLTAREVLSLAVEADAVVLELAPLV
jgi:ABC-type cobalamin/Fe3+-siderophores transport system ATPase subunit